jgi:beta-lactamase family protein
MRRVLTIITAIALVAGSLAVGTLTADLPFWRHAFDLPLAANEVFTPTITIGTPETGAVNVIDETRLTIDAAALSAAADAARAANAGSLLVAHHGDLQIDRNFTAPDRWIELRQADFLARPLAAISAGMALGDGSIKSLDDAVSKYLPEWDGDPRGRITLRQLLNETSGLATGVDAADVLGSHPLSDWPNLPEFATSRGVRLLLGNDYESTALGFRRQHEAGGFFNVSPVNSQLAAVIVEHASGMPYERFLEKRLLQPAYLFRMQLQMDRDSGMPAAHCCLWAFSRDALAIGELLRKDGALPGGKRLWPAGWVAEMLKGSRANPEFGLQIERIRKGNVEIWHLGGARGGALWIVPALELTVVVLADRRVASSPALLDPLLQALRK